MEAIIIKTGALIEVENMSNPFDFSHDYFFDIRSKTAYSLSELDFDIKKEKKIDWEQRRYELAKSAMQGYCIALGLGNSDTYRNIAIGSIRVAEEIIKQLKESEVKHE